MRALSKEDAKRAKRKANPENQDAAEYPFPSDSKRIIGRDEKILRIRIGDYRVQYVVYYDKKRSPDLGHRQERKGLQLEIQFY